jgi:hypothetical protein
MGLPSGPPGTLAPMTTAEMLHGSVASTWRRQRDDLARAGFDIPTRSTDLSVAEWTRLPDYLTAYVPDPLLAAMVTNGVAWEDLASFCRACLNGTSIPADAARILNAELRAGFGQETPEMSVRDALGWLLLVGQVGGDPFALATEWLPVVPEGDGWLFAAAGMTPVEVGDALTEGALDRVTVRTLIALRGDLLVPVDGPASAPHA